MRRVFEAKARLKYKIKEEALNNKIPEPRLATLVDIDVICSGATLLAEVGGVHDLTFLLKSFDIDLRMGYKLGTVFGYGYDEGQKGLDI